MKDNCYRILLCLMLTALLAPAALAQDEYNYLEVTVDCTFGTAQVHIDMDIQYDLPPDLVGWTIVRDPIGFCTGRVQIIDVEPFPTGEAAYDFTDAPANPGFHHKYTAVGVDAAGDYHYLSLPDFWPGYYATGYYSCATAPALRGTVTDIGWTLAIDACPDQCWLMSWFLSDPPPEMANHIGEVVDVYGHWADEFEGPYVTVESFTPIIDCDIVASEETSWGALKSVYR